MLLINIFNYFKSRLRNQPIRLRKVVDHSHHHGVRASEPSVAIIIPTRDKVELLRTCVESILKLTTYKNFSIFVVDNLSSDFETHAYLNQIKKAGIRVIKYPHIFNYPAICNFASRATNAEYLCFLNNDTEVLHSNWLSDLMDHGIQDGTGLVGSLLTYPDFKIQHAGISLGYKGVAGHPYRGYSLSSASLGGCFQVSAVTFACALIKKTKYELVGGQDIEYQVGLSDVDLAIRLANVGFTNVLCSTSPLMHHESATRKSAWMPKNLIGASREVLRYLKTWGLLMDDYFGL